MCLSLLARVRIIKALESKWKHRRWDKFTVISRMYVLGGYRSTLPRAACSFGSPPQSNMALVVLLKIIRFHLQPFLPSFHLKSPLNYMDVCLTEGSQGSGEAREGQFNKVGATTFVTRYSFVSSIIFGSNRFGFFDYSSFKFIWVHVWMNGLLCETIGFVISCCAGEVRHDGRQGWCRAMHQRCCYSLEANPPVPHSSCETCA